MERSGEYRHKESKMSFKITPPASAKLTFPCSECAFEAQSARQLSRHKAVTHTQNALKCVLCPFVTAYQTNLLRHRKDVHGICGSKGNKSCKFCGFVSEDNDTLIQHQIEYHQDILKSAQVKFAKELVSAGGDETFADFEAISKEFMKNKNSKKINLSKKQKKQKVKHSLNCEINSKANITPHSEENNEFDEFWKAGFIDQYEDQEMYYNQPPLVVNLDMQNESLNNSSRSSTPKSQSSHNLNNLKDLPATRIRRQYSCNDCGFRTVNPREFLYHRRDGHGYRIKIVECPYCVYACQYVQKLQRHLFLVHKLNVSPEMSSNVDAENMVVKRKYKKSQLIFNGNSILDNDMKHTEKDVSNDDCDDEQSLNDVGIEHMNNFEMNLNEFCTDNGNSKDIIDDNEDDQNYQMNLQCSICKIKFGDIVSAQKHFIKYHKYGDSKSYINSMDNDFASIQMTTNQKKVFDSIKNVHTCNYCGYKTRWISELERHVRVHSKEKPFKCMFCDFKSKWKGDLNRHIQRYHSNEQTLPEIESDASASGGNQHSTDMSPPTLMSRQDDETSNDINDSFTPDIAIANDYPNSYECLMEVDDEEFNAPPNTIDSGENIDADNDNEGSIQSPTNNTAKMYKCTYCDFMCNTASRFHVHYVQHLNTKPFQCSICGHRSNWEWDVTKHIKMKAQRDPSHEKAQPVLIHDSGKRDYSKYNKFVIWVDQAEAEMVNSDSNKIDFRAKRFRLDDENNGPGDNVMTPEVCFEVDGEMNYNRYNNYLPKRSILARYKAKSVIVSRHCNSRDQAISCLECDFKHKFARVIVAHMASHFKEKPYTCKYCHFDTNWREVIINHYNVEHENINNMDFDMRFRCIIDQNSICRIISVEELVELEATSSVPYESQVIEPNSSLIEPNIYEEKAVIRCELCPFLTTNLKKMTIHFRFHNSSKGSLKCKYCPYYVNNKDKLIRHQKLHQNVDTSNLVANSTDSICNFQPPTFGKRQTMINCTLCSFQTKNVQTLNEHMKIHDATPIDYENDINEDIANSEIDITDNRLNETENMNNDNNEPQFQPEFAENSSSIIEVNGMKNGNAKKFSYICSECPAAFKSPGDYKIHAVFHSSDYQHSCPYCTYKARTKPQLCKHLYVHTAEYISKRANSYPDGTKHTVGNPEPSHPISQQSSPTQKKKCTLSKQKQTKPGRKQRTKFKFPMKPVKVKLNSEENGKQNIVFNNTGLMANQEFLETKEYLQRIHSGIKNRCMYRCSNCPAVFTKVNTLIYHMTLHDQKDQFTCESCNYSTSTEDNLSIHSLLHNLTESQTAIGYNFNYNCHKCPAGFSKRTRLEKHISLHGEKFNWKCDKCDYSVRYAATLVKHRALHLINPNFQAVESVNGADHITESADKTTVDEGVALDPKTNLKLKLNLTKLRQNAQDENVQGKLKMTLNIPDNKDSLENAIEPEDSADDLEDDAIPQLVMADETEQAIIESN